jgi:hypothetical protein
VVLLPSTSCPAEPVEVRLLKKAEGFDKLSPKGDELGLIGRKDRIMGAK